MSEKMINALSEECSEFERIIERLEKKAAGCINVDSELFVKDAIELARMAIQRLVSAMGEEDHALP